MVFGRKYYITTPPRGSVLVDVSNFLDIFIVPCTKQSTVCTRDQDGRQREMVHQSCEDLSQVQGSRLLE